MSDTNINTKKKYKKINKSQEINISKCKQKKVKKHIIIIDDEIDNNIKEPLNDKKNKNLEQNDTSNNHQTISDNIINEKILDSKLKVIDLFCGCGGLTTGLEEAGLDVVAGIDIWNIAIESYKENHKHLAICEDIAKLSPSKFKSKYKITSVDIIVGGPPCQGFSIAGKRDKNDPRNSLFMEFHKYLKFFKPKAFIMENVMGILSMKTSKGILVIDIIMELLGEQYNCNINKLYASDFEVPQNRRRVIIIGIRKDLNIIPTEIKPYLTTDKRIPVKTILEKRSSVDKKYFLSEKAITGIKNKKTKSKASGNGFGAQFLDINKPSYTIPARYWKDGYDALVKYDDDNIRRLTINELKKIQSFPDNYILKGTKKDIIMQIGNAVACKFAYHLGVYIKNILQ